MNDPFGTGKPSSKYDPHGERLASRDMTFLIYMGLLGLLPLIGAIALSVYLFTSKPQFDSFQKGPAPFSYDPRFDRIKEPINSRPESPPPKPAQDE